MKQYFALIAVLVLIGVYINFNTTQISSLQSQLDKKFYVPYTFYVYEREWPSSVCKTKECKQDYMLNYNGKSFSQHGLWPSGSKTDPCYYPADCQNLKYDQSLVDPQILQWMNHYFVGLYSSTESFRAHEFEKHGTCFLEGLQSDLEDQENTYFAAMEILSGTYDINRVLEKYNIVPSDSKTYSYQEIFDAIHEGFKIDDSHQYDVKLRCLSKNGTQYLGAFQFCLDLDFKLGKCQCTKKGGFQNCDTKKQINFPVYHEDEIK